MNRDTHIEKKQKVAKKINVDSKPQVVFEGKAPIRFGSGAHTEYVSISKRTAKQPSDARWRFETTFEIVGADLC